MSLLAIKEVIRERFVICSSCEFLRKGLLNRCSACGCPIKTKVVVKSAECPKKKWFAVKE